MASQVASVVKCARVPIVVVLGATGAGKSKLALEIARRFSGEIISADSMQVYKGLDIVTNKVTEEEQAQVKHHLLDFVDPLSRYTVVDFRDKALPIIENLLHRGVMPVIVGGTTYYIESLLWKVLVDSDGDGKESKSLGSCMSWGGSGFSEQEVGGGSRELLLFDRDKLVYGQRAAQASRKREFESGLRPGINLESESEEEIDLKKPKSVSAERVWDDEGKGTQKNQGKAFGGSSESVSDDCEIGAWQDSEQPTEDLYERLEAVDPEMAAQYHPNNRRKIIRSLQVWEQTGRKHSDILRTQQEEGGSRLGGGLRFSNVALLWIDCDQDILDERLDARVDGMIEQGLLQELQDFHETYNASRIAHNLEADYTKGIFQSIGFKEFHDYLVLPKDQQDSPLGVEMYERGVEALKQVTRRYSRKQLKWIRNRILSRQEPKVYKVDGSDASRWDELARLPAEEVVQAFLSGLPPALAPEPPPQHEFEAMYGINRSDKTRFECEVCNRIVIGELQWTAHLKGNRHKKMLRHKARAEEKLE